MATATASRRATARQTRYKSSPAQERARLRVVPKGYKTKAARRRHARRILAVTSVSVCAIFFATLAFQVMITQGQFRLRTLNKTIQAEKQTFIKRRVHVGQLESPARIMQEAQARFGMTQPSSIDYLHPTRASAIDKQAKDVSDETLSEWSQLKHLQAALP